MYELIYHSIAREDLKPEDIQKILETAQKFNSENNITGCLLFACNEFAQILEGEKETILKLYDQIEKDKNHTHISILSKGKIESRKFQDWSMAFESFDEAELKKMGDHLNLKEFTGLIELIGQPTVAKELFYHLSLSMLDS